MAVHGRSSSDEDRRPTWAALAAMILVGLALYALQDAIGLDTGVWGFVVGVLIAMVGFAVLKAVDHRTGGSGKL